MSVTEKLKSIFADVFGLETDSITVHTSPEDIGEWDSLNHVNLISEIENEFDFTFDTYDIQDLATFGKICSYVESKVEAVRY
jgi:acyl carrier protein